jgi:hypothetical protein
MTARSIPEQPGHALTSTDCYSEGHTENFDDCSASYPWSLRRKLRTLVTSAIIENDFCCLLEIDVQVVGS